MAVTKFNNEASCDYRWTCRPHWVLKVGSMGWGCRFRCHWSPNGLLEPLLNFSDLTKHPSYLSISVLVVSTSHFKWSCQLHFVQYSSIEGPVFQHWGCILFKRFWTRPDTLNNQNHEDTLQMVEFSFFPVKGTVNVTAYKFRQLCASNLVTAVCWRPSCVSACLNPYAKRLAW